MTREKKALGVNGGQGSVSGFPVGQASPALHVPSNKGLERTRRVCVPASRAVVGVSPRRSTQCSTLSEVATNSLAGPTHHQCPASSACERRGCQPRSKAPLSRCEWSGIQPRQLASSSASEARDSHRPQAKHLGSGVTVFPGFKKERLLTSVKGSLLGLRVGPAQHASLHINQPRR